MYIEVMDTTNDPGEKSGSTTQDNQIKRKIIRAQGFELVSMKQISFTFLFAYIHFGKSFSVLGKK